MLISMLYIDQLKKLDLNMDKENASLVSIRTEWDELVLSRRDQSRIRKNFGRIISKRVDAIDQVKSNINEWFSKTINFIEGMRDKVEIAFVVLGKSLQPLLPAILYQAFREPV